MSHDPRCAPYRITANAAANIGWFGCIDKIYDALYLVGEVV